MLLLQFVTQSNSTGKVTNTNVNNPIVRAYPVSHPQAFVHTQGQSKFLVMGKGNASQALQTLALQKNQSSASTLSQHDVNKRTLQIQGLIPMQTHPSQVSPRGVHTHALPLQYVAAVNRPGFPITQPGITISQSLDGATYPLMQYIPPTSHVSYVYPATNTAVFRPAVSNVTSNFVRIAPAVQPPNMTVLALEQQKKKKEQEMLESMQKQLFGNSKDTSSGVTLVSSLISSNTLLAASLASTCTSSAMSVVSQETISAASSFLANIALGTLKTTTSAIFTHPTLTTSSNSLTEHSVASTTATTKTEQVISQSTALASSLATCCHLVSTMNTEFQDHLSSSNQSFPSVVSSSPLHLTSSELPESSSTQMPKSTNSLSCTDSQGLSLNFKYFCFITESPILTASFYVYIFRHNQNLNFFPCVYSSLHFVSHSTGS